MRHTLVNSFLSPKMVGTMIGINFVVVALQTHTASGLSCLCVSLNEDRVDTTFMAMKRNRIDSSVMNNVMKPACMELPSRDPYILN